jgi:hypothetical protein
VHCATRRLVLRHTGNVRFPLDVIRSDGLSLQNICVRCVAVWYRECAGKLGVGVGEPGITVGCDEVTLGEGRALVWRSQRVSFGCGWRRRVQKVPYFESPNRRRSACPPVKFARYLPPPHAVTSLFLPPHLCAVRASAVDT